MLIIILIFVLGLYYLLFKKQTKKIATEHRTQRVTMILSRLVMIAPLIGLILFTILFTTILKGRFVDRSSHALIVFILWMYATSFYIEVLRHFKNKMLALISAISMVIAVVLAITLTPLDRYCGIINSNLYIPIYALSLCMLVFIYIGHLQSKSNAV